MKQKATVRWFDNHSGEGMVRLEDGACIYVHYSAIDSDDNLNWKDVWRVLFAGQTVNVIIHEDYNWRQVSWLGG